MTSSASSASSSAAASQSTVFVTVGDGSSIYGYSAVSGSPYGSASTAAVLGKTIRIIISGAGAGFTIGLLHGGTPLSQTFFREVFAIGASGTKVFSTSNLGSSGSFSANTVSSSQWTWGGTGVPTFPWTVSDLSAVRVVGFLR